MAKPEPYFVGIDIGSSKVGVLIGQRDDKGGIEVVGKGLAPNRADLRVERGAEQRQAQVRVECGEPEAVRRVVR